ncbi:MAG: hypothetical protein WA160_06990 [Pseudobdellovibrio sp.]
MNQLCKLVLSALFLLSLSSQASETAKGAKKDYESFKTEMSAKLESVEKEIAELKVKAKQKGNAAQEDTASELEKSKEKLKSELAEIKSSSKSQWSKFKSNFANSVDSLNSKIQKAVKD